MTATRNKMSQDRRHSFRVTFALAMADCGTCGLPVCWSAETDSKAAHKATMGHVLAECAGGKAGPLNLTVQCWACNWSAKRAAERGIIGWDLTAYLLPNALRTWLPSKVAALHADPRECAPAVGLPDWQARKAARAARGYGW